MPKARNTALNPRRVTLVREFRQRALYQEEAEFEDRFRVPV
jgi:hypothetical protein